eukprot:3033819-Amphidinium_carterae.1
MMSMLIQPLNTTQSHGTCETQSRPKWRQINKSSWLLLGSFATGKANRVQWLDQRRYRLSHQMQLKIPHHPSIL